MCALLLNWHSNRLSPLLVLPLLLPLSHLRLLLLIHYIGYYPTWRDWLFIATSRALIFLHFFYLLALFHFNFLLLGQVWGWRFYWLNLERCYFSLLSLFFHLFIQLYDPFRIDPFDFFFCHTWGIVFANSERKNALLHLLVEFTHFGQSPPQHIQISWFIGVHLAIL